MAKVGTPGDRSNAAPLASPPTTPNRGGTSIVGRAREIEVMAEAITALAGEEHVPVLAIRGEPGIGKSRLLKELTALGEASSYLVLRGRAAELEQDLPFGLFV